MSITPTLVGRHTDATYRLIIDAAVEMLQGAGLQELTVRAVARRAGMSERTVFRYFASRDEFLDAVARAVEGKIGAPAPPRTLSELRRYPRELYRSYEEKSALVRAALHTELFGRIREGQGRTRWHAVRALLDTHAGHRSERDRKLAAANIRYYLSGTAWQYFRFYFGFTLEEATDAALAAVALAVRDITAKRPGAGKRRAP